MKSLETIREAQYAKAWAALDVYLGLVGAFLGLKESDGGVLKVLRTGGRYPLTGSGCPAQGGQNKFEHVGPRSQDTYSLWMRTRNRKLWSRVVLICEVFGKGWCTAGEAVKTRKSGDSRVLHFCPIQTCTAWGSWMDGGTWSAASYIIDSARVSIEGWNGVCVRLLSDADENS